MGRPVDLGGGARATFVTLSRSSARAPGVVWVAGVLSAKLGPRVDRSSFTSFLQPSLQILSNQQEPRPTCTSRHMHSSKVSEDRSQKSKRSRKNLRGTRSLIGLARFQLRNHYFKNQAEDGQIASRRDHAATTSKHAHNAHPSGIHF